MKRICVTHGREGNLFVYGWWWCPVFNERCKVRDAA